MESGSVAYRKRIQSSLCIKRKSEGWGHVSTTGPRTIIDIRDILTACEQTKDFVILNQIKADSNSPLGLCILMGSERSALDFRRCVIKEAGSALVDSTFQVGFHVTPIGHEDGVFDGDSGNPFFSIAFLLLSVRIGTNQYSWAGHGVKAAIKAGPGEKVAGWVTDGDRALVNGLSQCSLFPVEAHCFCETHLREGLKRHIKSGSDYSLLKIPGNVGYVLAQVYGSEKDLKRAGGEEGRDRLRALVDHRVVDFPVALDSFEENLVAWASRQGAVCEVRAFLTWFRRYQAKDIAEGYLIDHRERIHKGRLVGRVTTNTLESYNNKLHQYLANKPTLAHAIVACGRLLEDQSLAKEMALFSCSGAQSPCSVSAKYQSRLLVPRSTFLGMDTPAKLKHLHRLWPTSDETKCSFIWTQKGLKIGLQPEDFSNPVLHRHDLRKLFDRAGQILEQGSVVKELEMTETFHAVVGPEDGEPVNVQLSDAAVPLACGLGGECLTYRRTRRSLCEHTLAVAHSMGQDYLELYRDQFRWRAGWEGSASPIGGPDGPCASTPWPSPTPWGRTTWSSTGTSSVGVRAGRGVPHLSADPTVPVRAHLGRRPLHGAGLPGALPGPVPLACGLGGECLTYRRTRRSLCEHTLAVAHSMGQDYLELYRDQFRIYAAKHGDHLVNEDQPLGAGGKKARREMPERTRDVVSADLLLPRDAADRQFIGDPDFLRHHSIWTPGPVEVVAFAAPSGTPPSMNYHNSYPFLIELKESSTLGNLDNRRCASCTYELFDMTSEAPGDLYLVHKERQLVPVGRKGAAGDTFDYPERLPPSDPGSGRNYVSLESQKMADPGRWAWSKAGKEVKRGYHVRRACLFRHPHVTKDAIVCTRAIYHKLQDSHFQVLEAQFGLSRQQVFQSK